ncbi:YbhB/YbcL family Raf kinase inhibitor-like protein [Leptolyngbya sp. 7M]|uniref:YbhB/YbcL family Raf kinase inhibitor-like protein n=1 Tax=Leptolyngbya sp. 7M TaxID=2812896 RepID=UPI001B8CFF48|nr:YbhB/YbcL family Raf kinase inhibitor-like protein [Leptolyngbya sp. 7M]QYO64722.1 YbhB/YbcL family Raf kinase inhibitor-like protein [Leptolyngbya sp. 7M]
MANSLTRRRLLEWTSVVLAGWLVACDQGSRSADNRTKRSQTLDLSSPAFEPEAFIPVEFTCDGADHSPALSWSAPPEGTQSFTLILDDPDAPNGTFTHWVLYDLPPDSQSLPTAIPAQPLSPYSSTLSSSYHRIWRKVVKSELSLEIFRNEHYRAEK